MNKHLEKLYRKLSLGALFPEKTLVRFVPSFSRCPSGHALKVRKTHTREVVTLGIGHFLAHETQGYCPCCKDQPVFPAEELHQLIPSGAKFGYDVMVHVGVALFSRCRNNKEIQNELSEKNINISLREIDYLGRRFVAYLALVHGQSHLKLKQFMTSQGGYILHLDGTCEGDSPHLMSTIDGLSKIVMDNIKIPTENARQLIPFLRNIQRAYGNPIALVHDMGAAIMRAVEEVFPAVPDYICHFHFLKDIGKDLFGGDYSTIRRHLKAHRIRGHLRKMTKGLSQAIEDDTTTQQCLQRYLSSKRLHEPETPMQPSVTAYLIINWVLEAKNESHGFGFPFDRPHLDFYRRLQEAYPELKELKRKMTASASLMPLAPIGKTLANQALSSTVSRMLEKIRIFDQLREAMRIAQRDSTDGLNDEGDAEIKTIQARLTRFRHSEEITKLAATTIAYRKMVKQMDKYWGKLFADPIRVTTKTGFIIVQPQRTNNILEQFFRYLKRDGRKRSGSHTLTKTLKTMLAQTPLVKNLENPRYMEIILNGEPSLADRFARVDIALVRKVFAEAQEDAQKYPKRMAKIFKIPHLPRRLVKVPQKNASPA